MGIESADCRQPSSTHPHNLQKESPDMGIERDMGFDMFHREIIRLQKESPDMGIESVDDGFKPVLILLLAKRVPRHGD